MTKYSCQISARKNNTYTYTTIDVSAASANDAFITAAGKAFSLYCNTSYEITSVEVLGWALDGATENDSDGATENDSDGTTESDSEGVE